MLVFLSLLTTILHLTNQLAQPKGFTDDPYVDDDKFIERVVKHEVVGVIGEGVAVPCNCTPSSSHPGDRPALILWYKDRANLPIYSFDLRSTAGGGQHWKDSEVLGDRGYVYYEETPHSCRSSLNVEPVEAGDTGQYRCRVDYETSPTRNTRIKLKLVAPPTKPTIYSEAGRELVLRTHPLNLGSSLKLYCSSRGGEPLPAISWRKNSMPVSPVGLDVDSLSGTVTSTILLTDIKLEDQGAQISCTADNSALIPAQTTTVILDIIAGPVRAKLVREWNYFLAGESYNVSCQVLGSRPTATTIISLGDTPLNQLGTKSSGNGNISTSLVTFTPSREDDQKFLSCQARNKLIDGSSVEDRWKIIVHYKPLVSLSTGNNMTVASLGQDITFKCIVQSNPAYLSIVWSKEGSVLDENKEDNVHILDQTLFLSSVTKENSGDYLCTVTNQAGTTTSNTVTITVPESPASCLRNDTELLVVGEEELAELECQVGWSLDQGLEFTWTRTTARGEREELGGAVSSGSRSVLTYRGREEGDWDTVSCVAREKGGLYGQPCTYRIIIREHSSSPVMECNTFNQTFSSLTVSCSVRDLRPQSRLSKLSYQFEVKNAHSLELVRNVTTDTPALTVSGLPAASDFLISVYSSTGGVRSPAVSLEGFTTRPGEKQLATMPELEDEQPLSIIPLAAGLLLVSLLLVFIVIAIVAVVRRKISRASNSPSSQLELINNQKAENDLDYSPDIIPKDQGFGYCQTSHDLQYRPRTEVLGGGGERGGAPLLGSDPKSMHQKLNTFNRTPYTRSSQGKFSTLARVERIQPEKNRKESQPAETDQGKANL